MTKKSVNLIIRKETDSILLQRLNIFFPVFASIFLIGFALFFFGSIIYINNNITKYNILKKEIENLEKKISGQKGTEGIYKLTSSRLSVFEQIENVNLSFTPLISEIYSLNDLGVKIKSASADNKGNTSFALSATSSASLDQLVNTLIDKEREKLFSKIEAHGIIRDKNGNYALTITFTTSPTLLK